MSDKKILYVCHGYYGCETGCCGYRLCEDDEGDEMVAGTNFAFSHPYTDAQKADPVGFVRDEWDEIDLDSVEIRWGKWKNCD